MIDLFKVRVSKSIDIELLKTIRSGTLGQGPKEAELKEKLDVILERKCLLTNSCTSALDLSLHLIGVVPGDEVISTAQTCFASNSVIINRGAKIKWADVNKYTGCIDPESVYHSISPKTKAIMAVDWAGRACDYDKLKSFGIPVIEDAAHCWDTYFKGHSISTHGGDYICYSMQAIKFLTASDGGILITPEEKYDDAELLKWYGLSRKLGNSFRCSQNIKQVGYKYHLNDICATIGLCNLEVASDSVIKHRKNARIYDEAFENLSYITIPPPDPGCSYWLYSLLVEKGTKEEFIAYLSSQGISASPVHFRNDLYDATAQFKEGNLPGLDNFSSKQVSIPVGWWLSDEDVQHIVDVVRSYKNN